MDIINLTKFSSTTSINVFLIVGKWNSINGVNTLIDSGSDSTIIHRIINTHTGVERQRIKQVILTHLNPQNTCLLPLIKRKFNPIIYALSKNTKGIDQIIKDGDRLKIGDTEAKIIYKPNETHDSMCIYLKEEQALFSGTTPVFSPKYQEDYQLPHFHNSIQSIKNPIKIIYPGKGPPIIVNHFHYKNKIKVIR